MALRAISFGIDPRTLATTTGTGGAAAPPGERNPLCGCGFLPAITAKPTSDPVLLLDKYPHPNNLCMANKIKHVYQRPKLLKQQHGFETCFISLPQAF